MWTVVSRTSTKKESAPTLHTHALINKGAGLQTRTHVATDHHDAFALVVYVRIPLLRVHLSRAGKMGWTTTKRAGDMRGLLQKAEGVGQITAHHLALKVLRALELWREALIVVVVATAHE